MKLGVVGYRHFSNYLFLKQALDYFVSIHGPPECIISGACTGVDTLAITYAKENGITVQEFPPDRVKYPGNRCYYERNKQIVEASDMLIAFVSKHSVGTNITIDLADKASKLVIKVPID